MTLLEGCFPKTIMTTGDFSCKFMEETPHYRNFLGFGLKS